MRVFKTKLFAKFARRERIPDASLLQAIERAQQGLVDADLGGGVLKQRVARQGQGRSGGYRTLIAYRFGDFAVFLFGFAKNELDNIDDKQLASLQEAASYWLELASNRLNRFRRGGLQAAQRSIWRSTLQTCSTCSDFALAAENASLERALKDGLLIEV